MRLCFHCVVHTCVHTVLNYLAESWFVSRQPVNHIDKRGGEICNYSVLDLQTWMMIHQYPFLLLLLQIINLPMHVKLNWREDNKPMYLEAYFSSGELGEGSYSVIGFDLVWNRIVLISCSVKQSCDDKQVSLTLCCSYWDASFEKRADHILTTLRSQNVHCRVMLPFFCLFAVRSLYQPVVLAQIIADLEF